MEEKPSILADGVRPAGQEWGRSRYWLCHFLHNRHERQAIDWSAEIPLTVEAGTIKNPEALAGRRRDGGSKSDALARWLERCAAGRHVPGAWMIEQAAARHGNDPAYVQSLRLLAKERHYHADLARKLLVRIGRTPAAGARPGPLLRVGRVLGVRYELAALLLADLVDLTLLGPAGPGADDPAARDVCRCILLDKSAHAAFCAERLTLEFADFNFVRRNLRRARLRAIFAAKLALAAATDGGLIAASGSSRARFARDCRRKFEGVLEAMVPYRREELLRALLAQRERPYEKRRTLGAEG